MVRSCSSALETEGGLTLREDRSDWADSMDVNVASVYFMSGKSVAFSFNE